MINDHQAYEMALEYLDGMDVFASRQPFVSEDKEAFNIKQFNPIKHRLEAVRFYHPKAVERAEEDHLNSMIDLTEAQKQANSDYTEHGKNLNQYTVNSGPWFEYEEQYKIVNIYGELDDE